MNRFLLQTILFYLFFTSSIDNQLRAQAPQKFSYQAVIRNSASTLVTNKQVKTRIGIIKSSPSGNEVYAETHTSSTNSNGLLSLEIGAGVVLSGTLSGIDWSNGTFYIKIDTDPNGGNNYTISSVTQLLSVPYTLFSNISQKASTATSAENGLPVGGTEGQVLTLCNGKAAWTNNGICPGMQGNITSLQCSTTTSSGSLFANQPANGVSINIPYSGGNGGVYTEQSFPSTGITGLIASLTAGTFNVGSGSLLLTITGLPSGGGNAIFEINVGGQSCTLSRTVSLATNGTYPVGTVFCFGTPTAIVNVTNPATGKIWMDRNLGASQVATTSTDVAAYGDLYQWGRKADGHQCRASEYTAAVSSKDQPAHGKFIVLNNIGNYDWLSPQNNNLWQGVSGVNNPCPSTYRIPTLAELDAERVSWSSNTSAGAYSSPLKLPLAGVRNIDSSLSNLGGLGYFWSSSVIGFGAGTLNISIGNADVLSNGRAYGFSVRCIKD